MSPVRKIVSCVVARLRKLCLHIRSGWKPLELFPDAPDLFRAYRSFCGIPGLTRAAGGWIYRGEYYPDYLTAGGASYAIQRTALQFCAGHGVDIGAGLWPLPGALPIDLRRGPGVNRNLSEFQEETLDYAFSSHCLEHIEDWKSALIDWSRRIKRGGILFLYLPHPNCVIWHPGSPFVGDGHKWIPTPDTLKAFLLEQGFDIVASDDGPDAMQSFFVCGKKKNVPTAFSERRDT